MKILAIDTAHGICSVTLAEDGIIISSKTDSEPSKQAERLFSTIATILKENSLSYTDINAIAVDIGTGSFTGIRIGLAAARGIALAANIPVIGVTGFEALAFAAKTENDLLIVLDAKRGQVYAQLFSNGVAASEEIMLDYNEITNILPRGNVIIMGDGAALITPYLSGINHSIIEEPKLSDANMIALVAHEKIKSGNYKNNPAPLYIRKPDAKLPLNTSLR